MAKLAEAQIRKVVNAIEWDTPSLDSISNDELNLMEKEGFITRDHAHKEHCVFAASEIGEKFVADTPSEAEILNNKGS